MPAKEVVVDANRYSACHMQSRYVHLLKLFHSLSSLPLLRNSSPLVESERIPYDPSAIEAIQSIHTIRSCYILKIQPTARLRTTYLRQWKTLRKSLPPRRAQSPGLRAFHGHFLKDYSRFVVLRDNVCAHSETHKDFRKSSKSGRRDTLAKTLERPRRRGKKRGRGRQ